jgi:primosomal protein N' (replication factor Y)
VSRLENILRKESSMTVLGPVDAFVPEVQNAFWVKLYIKTQNLAAVRKVLAPILNAPKAWVPNVEIKVELE